MVGPRSQLHVDSPLGVRWDLALELLEAGGNTVSIGGLDLCADAATDHADRRLHVEIPCATDPTTAAIDHVKAGAEHELDRARDLIAGLTTSDDRFAMLVNNSDVLYEYVHDYGMGTILIAVARPTGSWVWK